MRRSLALLLEGRNGCISLGLGKGQSYDGLMCGHKCGSLSFLLLGNDTTSVLIDGEICSNYLEEGLRTASVEKVDLWCGSC
jgi:hypothetical protein